MTIFAETIAAPVWPGGDEARRPAVPDAVGRDADRGVALLSDRRGRGIVHLDDLRGLDDLDLPPRLAGRGEQRLELRGAPTRSDAIPNSRAAAIAPSTLTCGAWSPPIASTAMRMLESLCLGKGLGFCTVAGIIARRAAESAVSAPSAFRLLPSGVDRLLALVVAAVRAHAVRLLRLAAVRAVRRAPAASARRARGACRGGLCCGVAWDWASWTYTFFSFRSASQRGSIVWSRQAQSP